jgi:hypothetical protein
MRNTWNTTRTTRAHSLNYVQHLQKPTNLQTAHFVYASSVCSITLLISLGFFGRGWRVLLRLVRGTLIAVGQRTAILQLISDDPIGMCAASPGKTEEFQRGTTKKKKMETHSHRVVVGLGAQPLLLLCVYHLRDRLRISFLCWNAFIHFLGSDTAIQVVQQLPGTL